MLELNTDLTDTEIIGKGKEHGVRLQCLSQFCIENEERYDLHRGFELCRFERHGGRRSGEKTQEDIRIILWQIKRKVNGAIVYLIEINL